MMPLLPIYTPETDRRFRTADGQIITDGMPVWDYDLRLSIVRFADTRYLTDAEYAHYWDGWFDLRTPDGTRAGSMNGERMTTRHPYTRQSAKDALAAL